MSGKRPTALIADDEPLLRDALERMLTTAWPELQVVAHARNGREAVEQYVALTPDICFLDVHMPGMSGIEAAQQIGKRAHLVFVTAYNQYALQAFEHGVLDYLVKPVHSERLAETIARLQDRMQNSHPTPDMDALLQDLASRLHGSAVKPLRWLRASVGATVRLIPVEDIDFLRADEKYTLVAWHDEANQPLEAVIRTPLKELITQLNSEQFAQVHRSVVVNLNAISHVTRGANETADIHLKRRRDVLPVSRSYLHLFRQM